MNPILSPLVSEFETVEQATRHAEWVKAKVQLSLDDPRPGMAHDQVMAEMDAIIDEAEGRNNPQK